MKKKNRRLNHR